MFGKNLLGCFLTFIEKQGPQRRFMAKSCWNHVKELLVQLEKIMSKVQKFSVILNLKANWTKKKSIIDNP